MILTQKYTILPYEDGMCFIIKSHSAPLCPLCGVLMSGYDTRPRHCVGSDGVSRWFRLRRLRCPTCQKLHLELPDFMVPNKHYEAQVIADTISGSDNICPAENSTIRRWKNHPPDLPRK